MTDLELQTARDFILRCAARMPRGISKTTLEISLPAAGIELDKTGENSIDAHLRYLLSANLLAEVKKTHTPSLALYVITSAGDDYLRSQKLL